MTHRKRIMPAQKARLPRAIITRVVVDIEGLPPQLAAELKQAVETSEKELF